MTYSPPNRAGAHVDILWSVESAFACIPVFEPISSLRNWWHHIEQPRNIAVRDRHPVACCLDQTCYFDAGETWRRLTMPATALIETVSRTGDPREIGSVGTFTGLDQQVSRSSSLTGTGVVLGGSPAITASRASTSISPTTL